MNRIILIALVFLFSIKTSIAQNAGDVDLSFNVTDQGFGAGDGATGIVLCSAELPNGKFMLGGEFVSYNGFPHGRIARINADGSIDNSFIQGDGAYGSGTSMVKAIAVQSDGKIIIAGSFTLYNGQIVSNIARLNTDGTLDVTFNTGSGVNGIINTVIIQNDGKIVAAGTFTTFNGSTCNRIVRLNTNGSQDATFTIGTGFTAEVVKLILLSNQKIIAVAKTTFIYNGSSSQRFVQLTSFGAFDNLSGVVSGFDGAILDFGLLADGGLIVTGQFSNYNGISTNGNVAKLDSNGTIDNSFLL